MLLCYLADNISFIKMSELSMENLCITLSFSLAFVSKCFHGRTLYFFFGPLKLL